MCVYHISAFDVLDNNQCYENIVAALNSNA